MPNAPMSPCSVPRCPNPSDRNGRCRDHARQQDKQRGTAHARGYTYRDWQPFRRRFLASLVEHGILPVCGAALPTGPTIRDSACYAAGVLTFTSDDGSSLHLDHEPALQDHERTIVAAVCDPARIVLKCRSCHARKTARSSMGGGESKC